MSEYDISAFDVAGAERVGLPKGDDCQPCIAAFEAVTGIEVPDFGKDRKLSAISQGVEFLLFKGKDIPGFVDGGVIDLGVTGTDSCAEYAYPSNVSYQPIAEAMCRFSLMCEADQVEDIAKRLNDNDRADRSVMPVVTSKPKTLNDFAARRGLPLKALELPPGMTISGSLEIMPRLLSSLGVELVADLVASGETARQNGLVELMDIMDMYPALVQKAET